MSQVMMDQEVQAYMRFAASQERQTVQVGPFLCTISTHTDNPYLNYAIPEDGATPTLGEIEGLILAFEQHGRTPRLEYLPTVVPGLETSLLHRGFSLEARLPLMVYREGLANNPSPSTEIEVLTPITDEELRGMLEAQSEAFGGDGTADSAAVERLKASIKAGTIAVMALDKTTRQATGGGVCVSPYRGVSEIAGVGVRSSFRRRGMARALTARLVQEALRVGVQTIFLTPANEEVERIYRRVGFAPVSEVIHISLREQGGLP